MREQENGTRVAFVRHPLLTILTSHYPTTEIGSFEMSSLSMLLGSLNLTCLRVSSDNASLYRTWIYPPCGPACASVAMMRSKQRTRFYLATSSGAFWLGPWRPQGVVLRVVRFWISAALYTATEVIGKQTGSYAEEFGFWCKALGLKRVTEMESGTTEDALLVLSE